MKKYIIPFVFLALVSCTKGNDADYVPQVGGRTTTYYSNGQVYMMGLADNLVTDALDEIEWAFETEARATTASSHFDISRGSILQTGVVWKVTSNLSALVGTDIKCLGDNKWELSFAGPYELVNNTYDTQLKLVAIRGAFSHDSHYSWTVVVDGSRTERNGYSCTFSTPTAMEYQVTQHNIAGWDKVNGDLYMNVFKDGKLVDCCRLSFTGSPTQPRFESGL